MSTSKIAGPEKPAAVSNMVSMPAWRSSAARRMHPVLGSVAALRAAVLGELGELGERHQVRIALSPLGPTSCLWKIGDLQRLTPDMLGGPLGEFSAALSASTETPFELTASLTLGAASVAAARRIRVRVKPDYFEPANLWVLPSLAPGNRKSAVEKAAARPLREWERDQAKAMEPDIARATAEVEVAQARAKENKKAAAKAKSDIEARDFAHQPADIERAVPEIPKPPQLWTSDATPENLGVLLANSWRADGLALRRGRLLRDRRRALFQRCAQSGSDAESPCGRRRAR